MAIWRRLGNRAQAAWELCMMGNVAYRQGDYALARLRYLEGQQLSWDAAHWPGVAFACNSLGVVAFDRGEPYRARELHREALAIYRDIDHRRGIAWSLGRLGMAEALGGDPRVAARLIGAMSVLRAESGVTPTGPVSSEMEHVITALQEQLGSDAWEAAWQEGRSMPLEEAITFALDDAGRKRGQSSARTSGDGVGEGEDHLVPEWRG
jgi:hypothetical protein